MRQERNVDMTDVESGDWVEINGGDFDAPVLEVYFDEYGYTVIFENGKTYDGNFSDAVTIV